MNRQFAFTIVEIIVVVTVLGILTGVGVVGYNGWKARSAQNAVKSDLQNVAAAMENAKNFENQYPSQIPSTYKSNNSTVLTLSRPDGNSYCVLGTDTRSSVTYNIRSGSTEPTTGECSLDQPRLLQPMEYESGTFRINLSPPRYVTPSSYTFAYRIGSNAWQSVSPTSVNGLQYSFSGNSGMQNAYNSNKSTSTFRAIAVKSDGTMSSALEVPFNDITFIYSL